MVHKPTEKKGPFYCNTIFTLNLSKKMTVSALIVLLNFPKIETIFETRLLEIAHVIFRKFKCPGHNSIWRQVAIKIGSNGERCYSSEQVRTPFGPYLYQCPACSREINRLRRIKHGTACGVCCRARSQGQHDAAYYRILRDSPLQRRSCTTEEYSMGARFFRG
jgi:hypothetical protein